MKPTITYQIAMAAAQDAGNRHMRAAGRTKWDEEDWNHACETFKRLWPQPDLTITAPQNDFADRDTRDTCSSESPV